MLNNTEQMKKIFLFIFSILPLTAVLAQSYSPEASNSTLKIGLNGPEYQSRAKRYDVNQYFASWTKGTLFLRNDEVITDIFLRYDQFTDELLWLRETDFKTGVVCHDDVTAFELYDDSHQLMARFVNKRIKLGYKPDSTDVFLQHMVSGPLELYVYRKVKEAGNYALLNDTYYLLFAGKKSYFTGLSSRQVEKVPVIDQAKMKTLLKSREVRLDGTETALVNFMQAYNKQ
jgi:hypothetical protein